MEAIFRHNLGDRVQDRISGLRGIITSRVEHLFGCARYWVEAQEIKNGKTVDGRWFDEDSIEVIEPGVIAPRQVRVMAADALPSNSTLRRAGGPVDQPASHTGPAGR